MMFRIKAVKVALEFLIGPNDILNDNSEGEDVKLEAYEIYDQVQCEDCGKVFNNKQYLSQHVTKVHQVTLVVNLSSPPE